MSPEGTYSQKPNKIRKVIRRHLIKIDKKKKKGFGLLIHFQEFLAKAFGDTL
jgi:hypothetical protein